ncbi:transcriptional regulator, SARP family (plasmid) [Streptantibioticus cattleyicolor NRRL 8057 = DSM 46488]|uniref:Transcriptional regulator, SARP family n=1 Tax=Streptantibioticus cattleyicolor (strain ATCC 35852 / DSM 46488 / JCM 4925 / NBRC 14057 / NRRL 8057) TaxID=1003195 RepID=G8XGA2_STREN|nr:transcriptional regulator, SARP family [Streptantibioticus cattleyicolor NRRL 8057 = DSM 46488]
MTGVRAIEATRTRLRFALLGPVRVWHGDQPLPAGSPQQRAVLAALLVNHGRPMTADDLIDAVWGDDQPSQVLAAVRTYAARLRKIVGPGTLVSEAGGYVLRVPPEALDLTHAERHALEAERASAAGDHTRARQLLTDALDLWDGEALTGVPGPFAETQRTRLAEWRLTLLERRLEADLERGAHAEAASELTALTADHPLRERLRALLMLALYRDGRQAEALAVYTDTRRLLTDELGVEPGSQLREIQQRILRSDPELLREEPASATPPVPAPAAPVVPAQLPRPIPHFHGREAEIHRLTALLTASDEHGVPVHVITGPPGAGKSALACVVAHEVAEAYPDGQLHLDLRGSGGSPLEPARALEALLWGLGAGPEGLPADAALRAALLRTVLAGRRVLIVLDDAEDAEQVRPLLPGTRGCAVLVTARGRLPELSGVDRTELGPLDPDSALRLLAAPAGPFRTQEERAAAEEIAVACGFHPLALEIAGSLLAARPGRPVVRLADALRDGDRRLARLRHGRRSLEAVLGEHYRRLPPDQAHALRLLALAPPGSVLSLDAAAALLDTGPSTAEHTLDALTDLHHLRPVGTRGYELPVPLGDFARFRAADAESPADRRAARSRLLGFHLALATAAYAVENPGDPLPRHLATPGHPAPHLATREEARQRVDDELALLWATVERTVAEDDPDGTTLRRAVDALLAAGAPERGATAWQAERVLRAVVAASAARHEPAAEGRARLLLGHLLADAGRFGAAWEEAVRSHRLGAAHGDRWCAGYAAVLRGRLRDPEGAALLRSASDVFRAEGDAYGEAAALGILARTGDPGPESVERARRAVELYAREGAGARAADGHYALGVVLCRTGADDEALPELERAADLFRQGVRPLGAAMASLRIARVHRAAGRSGACVEAAGRGVSLLRALGHDYRTAYGLGVLGDALAGDGRLDRARDCHLEARALAAALEAPAAERVLALTGAAA